MASFTAHLYGGAAVSAGAALALQGFGWAEPQQTQLLFVLGVVGGLLPDIDSDGSKPVRGAFTLLGVVLAFFAGFALMDRFPVGELLLIWGGVFVLVRYGFLELFARFTVHRGIWHSWLAAAFAGLATTNLAHHMAGLAPWDAWLAGAFVALGYLTHLSLDELASVDLFGHRVRRSFGTALKPFSIASPGASLAMLAAVVLLSLPAPGLEPVLKVARGQGPAASASSERMPGPWSWSVSQESDSAAGGG
jgi:hypothetical protein